MSWFALAILSVFALAVAELTQQYLLTRKDAYTERTSAVLTFLAQWLLAVPVVFIVLSPQEIFGWFNLELFGKILAVALLSSVGMIFYLRSFKVKSISYSQIFGSVSVLVSTALGIMIFQESTAVVKFLGILLVIIAIVLLNYHNVHIEKNNYYALLSGVIFGICFTFDKYIVQDIHPLTYIFWSFLLLAVFGFLAGAGEAVRSVKSHSTRALYPIAISAVGYFAYNFLTFSAYTAGGDVGSIDAINNSVVFIVIVFEFAVMKNRHSLARKLLTTSIAVLGITLIGLA